MTETRSVINQNNMECEICFDKRPVYVPLINCTHSHNFCEECVKKWFLEGHSTCPKCRVIWPIQSYVSQKNKINIIKKIIFYFNIQLQQTNQSHVNITNASFTLNYHRPSTIQNIHSPSSSTAGRLVHNIFRCYSIGLLLGLIIYPTIK